MLHLLMLFAEVYDITEHLISHEGWNNGAISTPLSILAHAGTDCSSEFHAIHRTIPLAYKQLPAYYIGPCEGIVQQPGG